MRCECVEVYVSVRGKIIIKQDDVGGGDQMIALTKDQIPLVISWLKMSINTATEVEKQLADEEESE